MLNFLPRPIVANVAISAFVVSAKAFYIGTVKYLWGGESVG